jgi:hypothetical protein
MVMVIIGSPQADRPKVEFPDGKPIRAQGFPSFRLHHSVLHQEERDALGNNLALIFRKQSRSSMPLSVKRIDNFMLGFYPGRQTPG